MSNAPAGEIQIDAQKVIAVLQESNPDAVRYAVWRVRAEELQAENDQLRSAQDQP